jgi:hypothetical protein
MGCGKSHSLVVFELFVARYPACQTETLEPSSRNGRSEAWSVRDS